LENHDSLSLTNVQNCLLAGVLGREADVFNASEETDLPPLVLQYLLGQEAPIGDDIQAGNYGTVIVPGSYGSADSSPLPSSSGAINTTVVKDGKASILESV
jgi:hypothetical protein